jgi:enolase
MSVIRHLSAWEILDSRGRPTVAARCELESGAVATASVPAGASRGEAEARELRDGDARRFGGWGCRQAVASITGPIHAAVRGEILLEQEALDRRLIELDGTADKSRLGANALLAVSWAFCRAQAAEQNVPLYRHLMQMVPGGENGDEGCQRLPRMTINLFSGGKHAGGQVAIQDLLVVPVSAATIEDGLADVYAVYQAAARLIEERYGMRVLRADEGGLAPPFRSTEAMFTDAMAAIEAAGLVPGKDIALAVDVAASHFHDEGCYVLDGKTLDGPAMLERLQAWCRDYPLVSLEDGLAENDWEHWSRLRASLDRDVIVLGDDHLCTNPRRIERAIAERSATGLLLKVNQIGTLTEACEAGRMARNAGWQVTVSARSGETEDDWLADLAVAWGDQIKVGSITQSERLAKYNRLWQIERETGWPVHCWPGKPASPLIPNGPRRGPA